MPNDTRSREKDPVCGMPGTIPAYGHLFCSKDCIRKYETREGITPPWYRRAWSAVVLYTVISLALAVVVALLHRSGAMQRVMGGVLIIVAGLKMLDWKGFGPAFAAYDLIAARSAAYAYAYPALELLLGAAFMFDVFVMPAATMTLIVMSVGAIGVAQNLLRKNPVRCACLGTLIRVPLTKFTLFEDVTMAVMAFVMLVT